MARWMASRLRSDNVRAEADALVADIDVRSGYELADFVMPFPTERTGVNVTSSAMRCHGNLPYNLPLP